MARMNTDLDNKPFALAANGAQDRNRTENRRLTSDGNPLRFLLDCLTLSSADVSCARGESNYDYDNTDWQGENHQQGSRAKGCAFV